MTASEILAKRYKDDPAHQPMLQRAREDAEIEQRAYDEGRAQGAREEQDRIADLPHLTARDRTKEMRDAGVVTSRREAPADIDGDGTAHRR